MKSSAFGSRLVGVLFERSETNNISSLVYMQGWDDAITNIIRTNGIGLGFNMMGCDPLPLVGYRDTLINLDPELVGLNAQDGSFLVSKFISEFGVIGILIIILTISQFYSKLRINKVNSNNYHYNTMVSLVYICLVIFFLRTSGYFSSPFLIFLVSFLSLFKIKLLKNN